MVMVRVLMFFLEFWENGKESRNYYLGFKV